MEHPTTSSRTPIGLAQRAGVRPAGRVAGRYAVRVLPHLLVALLVLLAAWPTVLFPFGPDQAIFATIARTIWQGGMPFADAWDQKPPAIYLLYALATRGPFGLMQNVRVFDLAWLALTCVLLTELGRRWWNTRTGVIAALLYGGLYANAGYWYLAQPDGFIALPIVLALLAYEVAAERGGRASVWLLIAAGALLGFAFQLRFIVALLIPAIPIWHLRAMPAGQRWRAWLRDMLLLGAGFVAVQAAILLYLLAGRALDDYIAATRWASGYTNLGGAYAPEGLTFVRYLDALRYYPLWWTLERLVLTVPAFVGGFYGAVVLRERRVQQVLILATLAWIGIAAQAKFFVYHFLYLLPFLALTAGWGWDQLIGTVRRRYNATATGLIAGGVGAVFLLATPVLSDGTWYLWRDYRRYHVEPEWRDSYYDQFGPWNGGTFSYRASREAAFYVRQRTAPEDTIYVWGYDPLVYLLAERQQASRFIYSFPLMTEWSPPSWQGEFIDDLRQRRPAYILIQRYEGAPWITGQPFDSGEYVEWFPAFKEMLETQYAFAEEIEDYLIYERADR